MESVLEALLNLPNVRVFNSEFTGQGDLVCLATSSARN